MGGGGASTVESTIEVNTDNIAIMVEGAVHHGALGPWNTSVGNKNVQTAIEILHNGVDGLLDLLRIGDLNLIGFGYVGEIVR